jgi:cadmium resistance protein CadD (predicted permease)
METGYWKRVAGYRVYSLFLTWPSMEILITSIVAFTSTNLDDIFLLTLFYGNKEFKSKDIIVGQLLGISTLIAVSLIGSLIGLLVPQAYIGLLGLIPMFLGLKGIWGLVKGKSDDDEVNMVSSPEIGLRYL